MIERVARALWARRNEAERELCKIFGEPPPILREDGWINCVEDARAAIEAAREPTAEMLEVWKQFAPTWDHSTAPPTLRYPLASGPGETWKAGIEAALK